jgi:hypothetical protein
MFDKLGQFAEQAATNVSRRQFLGGLGRTALAVAAAAGALLALPSEANAVARGTLCSPTCSTFTCTNNLVGGLCSTGKCVAARGYYDSYGLPCCSCKSPKERVR